MAYYAPKLPLKRDPNTGYEMLDDLKGVVKQNFRMLILTVPGERIMNPDFGVGLYKYLFEHVPSVQLQEAIKRDIIRQTTTYMSYISIKDISFQSLEGNPVSSGDNSLYVRIEYYIKTLNANDILEVSVSEQDF